MIEINAREKVDLVCLLFTLSVAGQISCLQSGFFSREGHFS